MKVYVVIRFERREMQNHYGDYGRYYEEESRNVDVYLNEETADRVAEELYKKWGNDNYEEEITYYVEEWEVNEE